MNLPPTSGFVPRIVLSLNCENGITGGTSWRKGNRDIAGKPASSQIDWDGFWSQLGLDWLRGRIIVQMVVDYHPHVAGSINMFRRHLTDRPRDALVPEFTGLP